jgi:F-type H+-transporting ATPase subunit b
VQFDLQTAILEVINFLVLVWLLKRFLYKPVLRAIGERRAAVEKTLADAGAQEAAAQALEEKYQHRLDDWEKEKEHLCLDLDRDIRTQRESLTAGLHRALDEERKKQSVLERRRMAELERQAEERGVNLGLQFTASLLQRIASPELEAKLAEVALEDLAGLPDEQKKTLRAACRDSRNLKVASAFPLSQGQRDSINQALSKVADCLVTAEFEQDPGLMAGIRIAVGPWMLRANLHDELAFFSERTRNAG